MSRIIKHGRTIYWDQRYEKDIPLLIRWNTWIKRRRWKGESNYVSEPQ